MPKISIILPVYNAEKYLHLTLESVLDQSFTDFELICVNDGSSDNSGEILVEYHRKDQRIKIINQANMGGSAARNNGINSSTGDYIMFIDSDDLYAAGIVDKAYKRAVKSKADIVLFSFARFIGKPTFLAVTSKVTPGHDIEMFNKSQQADRFFNHFATITWNKLVKRSLVVDNNLRFDVNLSHNHDVDFSIRAMLLANTFSWINDVGYLYRINESGLTATKRNDPTNILKILINLNDLFVGENAILKRSFDNYVVDMVFGTLEKYEGEVEKQEQIITYTRESVFPALGIDNVDQNYIFSVNNSQLSNLKNSDIATYLRSRKSLKKKIRRKVKKIHNKAQALVSLIAV